MIAEVAFRTGLLVLLLAVAGCGGSVQHAGVGGTRVPRATATEPTGPEVVLDRARSRVEVAGSDRLTGEHVAVIRALDARVSGVDVDHVAEVVIRVDLRSLHMASSLIESFVKSPDFLDVERFPTARFRSDAVEHATGELYRARGVLELHGVSREIEFVAHVTRAGGDVVLRADFLLPRRAFEIRRHDGWDFLISDDFRVQVEIVGRLADRKKAPGGA